MWVHATIIINGQPYYLVVGQRAQQAASKLACLDLSSARSYNHDTIIIDCMI